MNPIKKSTVCKANINNNNLGKRWFVESTLILIF